MVIGLHLRLGKEQQATCQGKGTRRFGKKKEILTLLIYLLNLLPPFEDFWCHIQPQKL